MCIFEQDVYLSIKSDIKVERSGRAAIVFLVIVWRKKDGKPTLMHPIYLVSCVTSLDRVVTPSGSARSARGVRFNDERRNSFIQQ